MTTPQPRPDWPTDDTERRFDGSPEATGGASAATARVIPIAEARGQNTVSASSGGGLVRAVSAQHGGLGDGERDGEPARARDDGNSRPVAPGAGEETPDERVTGSNTALRTAHSPRDAESEGYTRPHARAREAIQKTAVTLRHITVVSARFAARDLRPPDIWSEPRPSLRQTLIYAWDAPYAPSSGFWRRVGQIYGVTIALPLRALLAIADWVVERPSRVAVVFLIFIVAVLAGPGAWLLEIGLDVNEQVTGLLSHIAGRR